MPRRKNNAARSNSTGPGESAGAGNADIDLAGFETFDAAFDGTGAEPSSAGAGAEPSSAGAGAEPANAGAGATTESASAAPRRRGRPAGSLGKKKESVQDIDSITAVLFSLHEMAAGLTKMPELEITQNDAQKIALSVERVRAFYPTNFNPKVMAWVNLGTTLSGIYGIQFMAVRNRFRREAAKARLHTMPSPQQQPAPQQPAPATPKVATGISVPSQFHPMPPVGDYE